MKHLARALLKLVTLGIPVVIAACYGMTYRFTRSGKVTDRATHDPLKGIQVTCLTSTGETADVNTTIADGSFTLFTNTECATVKAEDIDGAANGGSYQTTSVPCGDSTSDVTVQMDKVP